MTKYRHALPQLGQGLFLTDGGLETTVIFHQGVELPDFAAFTLIGSEDGEAALRDYFRSYAQIAKRLRTGLILESATWRANADWGTRQGYSTERLAEANRGAVRMLTELRSEFPDVTLVVSGCIGPRGDGYVPDQRMSVSEAEAYHAVQIETFVDTEADMACVMTMNYVEEAVGVTRAARRLRMPIAVSFTVETDGKLATGDTLRSAIEAVEAATDAYPVYYMINCAHPTHFEHVLAGGGEWVARIRGIRANASTKSHAELNEATKLDIGNPAELGRHFASLRTRYPQLNVLGGCCGTDQRHIEHIGIACTPLFATSRPGQQAPLTTA